MARRIPEAFRLAGWIICRSANFPLGGRHGSKIPQVRDGTHFKYQRDFAAKPTLGARAPTSGIRAPVFPNATRTGVKLIDFCHPNGIKEVFAVS